MEYSNTYTERLTALASCGKSYVCNSDDNSLETIIRCEFLHVYDILLGDSFFAEIDDRGKIIPTTIRKSEFKKVETPSNIVSWD